MGQVICRAWFEAWNWLFFHVRLPAAYAWERSKYALLPWVRARRDRTASYGARFGPGWLPFIDVGPGWRPLVARLEADHLLIIPDNPTAGFDPTTVSLKGRNVLHLIQGQVVWIGRELA